jgi:hypothetical protein
MSSNQEMIHQKNGSLPPNGEGGNNLFHQDIGTGQQQDQQVSNYKKTHSNVLGKLYGTPCFDLQTLTCSTITTKFLQESFVANEEANGKVDEGMDVSISFQDETIRANGPGSGMPMKEEPLPSAMELERVSVVLCGDKGYASDVQILGTLWKHAKKIEKKVSDIQKELVESDENMVKNVSRQPYTNYFSFHTFFLIELKI